MSKFRIPVVGKTYSVVCPSCYSTVSFTCDHLGRYGVACDACGVKISLEDPHRLLSPTDTGYLSQEDMHNNSNTVVYYSPEVEESSGLYAGEQVSVLIKNIEHELGKEMPERMTEETTQAYVSKRMANYSKKFFFFFPIVWAIEFILMGRRPYTTIGHVRIFRRYVPFKGYVYFTAPKTTTSSALPLVLLFVFFPCYCWFCAVIDEGWLYKLRNWAFLGAVGFFVLLVRMMFVDPGYIRPGYVDSERTGDPSSPTDRTWGQNELTLKEIEANKRESKWETIHRVAMERKWCSTCQMHRPVRAAHCYHCGLCCYDHDHHCGVLGICIGRRNALAFTLFLMETSTFLFMLFFSMASAFYRHTEKLSLPELFLSCVLFLIILAASLSASTVMLSMFYGFATETTTRERMQYVYIAKNNPFDRGFWRNVKHHLWERQPTAGLFDENFVKLYTMLYGKGGASDAKSSIL